MASRVKQASNFIVKHKVVVALGLMVLILGSGLWLSLALSPATPQIVNNTICDDQTNNLAKIKELEGKVVSLEATAAQTSNTVSPTPAASSTSKSSGKIAGATTTSGMVNINTATLAQLDTLPGVGPPTAQKIIDYRTAHGNFKTIDEIINVKGIGPKTFEKMKSRLTI